MTGLASGSILRISSAFAAHNQIPVDVLQEHQQEKSMFGIDLFSLVVGIALGATFPAFFKMVWAWVKNTKAYATVMGWFGK